jgi:hypothetical protein
MARLSHVLIPERESGSRTGHHPKDGPSAMARRQAAADQPSVGARMGAWLEAELSKTQEHRTNPSGRCPDSNPRRRRTKAVSSPLDHRCLFSKWGRWDLNQPPTTYQIAVLPLQHRTMVSRDGRTRTDDTVLPRPPRRGGARRDSRFPTSRQSERPDLNRRSRGPRPRAIPSFATFWLSAARTTLRAVPGVEPNLLGLKDR